MSIPDPTTPSDQAAARQEGRHDLDRILRASHHSDLARLLTLLAFFMAGTVILGWLTGSQHLVTLAPGLPTMKLNTALAVSLLAIALLCLSAKAHPTWWRRSLAFGCCALASSLSISALIEHASGRLPLVDIAIFNDPFTPIHGGPPGLMSQAAAIGLILTSIAILANSNSVVLACSTLAATVASTAAVAFLFRADGPGTIPFFSTLSVVSAFSIALLNAARLVLLWRTHTLRGISLSRCPRDAALPLGTLLRFMIPLGVGLLATASVTMAVRTSILTNARIRFERLTESAVRTAERRVNLCVYGLKGARGVFAASDSVTAPEFARYVASRDLATEFPGALGFGVIAPVPRDQIDAFAARERSEQSPDFTVKSSGTLDPMYVTRFIEPRQPNLAAWGFDVGSESRRREALEFAVDSGQPTITKAIHLVQDSQSRLGFLYYVPFYQPGSNPQNPAERRAALSGVLFAPIVLELALDSPSDDAGSCLDLELFDAEMPTRESLVFDADSHLRQLGASDPINASSFRGRMFWSSTTITVGGRPWTAVTSTTPAFDATIDTRMVALVAVCGSALTVLLSFIIWTNAQARVRALTLATAMNADLQRLALVAERTTNAVVITDAAGHITWVNDGFTRLTGYHLDEVRGRKPGSFLQCERTDPVAVDTIRHAIQTGEGCRVELVNRGKNGNEYSLELDIQPIRNDDGVLSGFIAIESDVTERVAQRDSLRQAKDEAEAALREARALRDTLDEHAIVSVADASGIIIDVNPAFCKISGYTAEELIGQDHHVVNSGIHSKQFWVEMWRTIAAGRPWRGEVCNRAKDGSLYWVDSMIAPFRDASGRIVKYVSIRTDITARKHAEAAIAKTTQMLRRTGSMARVGGWELDVATMTPIWSDEVYAIHDLEPGTPIDVDAAYAHYPEDARDRIRDAIHAAIHSQKGFDLILPFVTAKGTCLWVRSQGEPIIEHGKVTRLAGAFQDVTQEVTQKLRAEEQAERVELTVRSGGLGTWDWNCLTGEVVFNDIWSTMLGYGPGEIEGHVRSWERLVHPDDMPHVMSVLTDHLEGRTREYRCEHRLLRKDGSWAWVLDSGMVTKRDEEGKPLRAAGVHVDITKAKEFELTLSEAKQAAEAATRTKSEFLANMSHEIRTPLTAILGYADILREEGDITAAPPHRIQTIDTIRSAGQHLLTVINDILDLSKIEAGKMTVETIETPLVRILHEVQSLMAPRAQGKGVQLSTRFDSPVPDRIQSDPTRLRQILMNLVGNAAKFTEAGSITTAVRVENDRLLIDIHDTGAGMTQEQAAGLFAAFVQADTTVTRRHGGTGLGLTICRRLGELLGGSVTLVRTAPGEGSCFRVDLPAVLSPDVIHVTGFDAVHHDRNGSAALDSNLSGRILLAEDGIDNQRLIAFHLRRAGATVEIADNGLRALEMLSAPDAAFDLLLTDIQMPEMDGYTLTRKLRASGSRIPIVALTAHAMAEDRRRCTEAGCDDYATKPIDKSTLLAVCSKWLHVSKNRPETNAAAA